MSSTGYIIIKTKNRKEIDHMTSILKIAPSLVGCVSIRSLFTSIPRLVPFPFALLTLRSLRTNQTRRGWMRKGRERIRTG